MVNMGLMRLKVVRPLSMPSPLGLAQQWGNKIVAGLFWVCSLDQAVFAGSGWYDGMRVDDDFVERVIFECYAYK